MDERSLGILEKGNYTIVFNSSQGYTARALEVEAAPTTNIDNLNYATVTNAYIPDLVASDTETVKVLLSGILNSSCTTISGKPQVLNIDDVIVLLPEVQTENAICLPIAKPFVKEVEIKTPGVGRYLLHVRSAKGRAVNRLFSVVE
jgi:hypothetical protein